MITGKQFRITYYSNKDAKHITRNALWDDKSKYFESKNGNNCMTYWDIDANGYRTATKSWSVRS